MKSIVTVLFLLMTLGVRAQFSYVVDLDIPVEINNESLPLAWAGGLNATQYNTMDLNDDGLEDLVLFDRMADKVSTFLNQDNQYHYAPEYESYFPTEIMNWLLLRDYNCDGKKDIFTGDILGIRVFTNISEAGGPLTWKHKKFYDNGGVSNVLLTKGFSVNKINLQLQFDDVPAILDADGDGDLDIFSVRFAGNGTLEYHKNLGIENFTCDSLDYQRQTIQWGGFTECTCGSFAFNGADCSSLGGRIEHAGGKSLLMMDADGDAKLDVIMSEATCSRLYFLGNSGDLDNPIINNATLFPASNAVNLPYPAAFFEDVDFDGKKDLISSTAIYSKTVLSANLQASNWFYKNIGTTSNPTFSLVQSNFLQDQMIDVGDNAVPAFADMDADGDNDLFISRNTSTGGAATILAFENIGTITAPKFRLVDDNYLDFASLNFYNLKIQFKDLNRDNKLDLIFTATSLINGTTRLAYVPNRSSNGLSFQLMDGEFIDFEMASMENILVVDVNQDGLPDLLHGRSNGALSYWKNSGNLNFELEDDEFLGVGSSVLRQNLSSAVGDLNGDDKDDLILGDQTGELRILSDFRHQNTLDNAVSSLVWNPKKESLEVRNLGGRIWPTIVNLYGAAKPSIVAGTVLGGLTHLRPDQEGELPEQPVIKIYPNPVAKSELLKISVDRPATFQVIAMTGQILSEPVSIPANLIYQYPVFHLAAGVYIFRFNVEGKSIARRVVVR